MDKHIIMTGATGDMVSEILSRLQEKNIRTCSISRKPVANSDNITTDFSISATEDIKICFCDVVCEVLAA